MKNKSQIEAALERSLRKQVAVPRLDRKFDARVWARIKTEQVRAAAPAVQAPTYAATATARWLYIINVVGLGSVVIFLCVFGWQMLSGMDFSVSLPEISPAARADFEMNVCTIIATLACAVGFLFTPWGRRVRDEFG